MTMKGQPYELHLKGGFPSNSLGQFNNPLLHFRRSAVSFRARQQPPCNWNRMPRHQSQCR
ncbi:hypothetical protein BLAT2472_120158 [Burkholderia latens]